VVSDQAVDELPMRLERGKRALLILAHQPAVASSIGCHDGGKAAIGRVLRSLEPWLPDSAAQQIAPGHINSLWAQSPLRVKLGPLATMNGLSHRGYQVLDFIH